MTDGKDLFLEEAESVKQSLFDETGPKHPATGLPGHYMRPILSSKVVIVPIRELNRHYVAKFTVNNIEYDLSMTSHSNHIGIFDDSCKECDTGKLVDVEILKDNLKESDF